MGRKRGTKPFFEDGAWRIRWTDHAGRRRGESYEKQDDAAFALQRHEFEVSEIRRGLRAPLEAPNKTFDELFKYWMKIHAPRKRTRADMKSIIDAHLEPAFGKLALRHFNTSLIDTYVEERSHLNYQTIGNHLTLLRTMLGVAKEQGWILTIPKIRKPKCDVIEDGDETDDDEFRFLKNEREIARFLKAARDAGAHVHALYATAIYTGMRAGELAGLKWSNVDFEGREIKVRRSFKNPPKTKSSRRTIPIFNALLPILREWRIQCPGELVFPNKRGTMLCESARIFQETLHDVLDKAEFTDVMINGKKRHYVRFHDLRHTFASTWMRRGGTQFKLRILMGHTTSKMTDRYVHTSTDAIIEEDLDLFGEQPPAIQVADVIPLISQK